MLELQKRIVRIIDTSSRGERKVTFQSDDVVFQLRLQLLTTIVIRKLAHHVVEEAKTFVQSFDCHLEKLLDGVGIRCFICKSCRQRELSGKTLNGGCKTDNTVGMSLTNNIPSISNRTVQTLLKLVETSFFGRQTQTTVLADVEELFDRRRRLSKPSVESKGIEATRFCL